MALFGFKSKKEVEEEKRLAAAQAARQVVQNNMTNLSNLSKGSQVKFAVPYFDVLDPRFMDQGVPVSVHGMIVYSIDDMDLFHQINKNEAFSDETFQNKLRGQVTKYVKAVVANAPADAQIPVVHIERKILEISELVQKYVTPKIEQLFAITVRSLDITSINIDKESPNYRQLKALTSDLERDRVVAQNEVAIDSMRHQGELKKEMSELQSVEMLKMQMEDQRERMRIQRDGMEAFQEQQIADGRFGRSPGMMGGQPMMGGGMMGGGMMGGQPMMGGAPAMGGMQAPPPMMSAQYYVGINGQQMGPFDVNMLRQMAQQGQLNAQTQVWTQGMPQWAPAGTVAELAALFAAAPMGATPPPMGGGTPPPMGGGSTPAPTL